MSEVANETLRLGDDSSGSSHIKVGQEVYYSDGIRAGNVEALGLIQHTTSESRHEVRQNVYYSDSTPAGVVEALSLGRRRWFTFDKIARVRAGRVDLKVSQPQDDMRPTDWP